MAPRRGPPLPRSPGALAAALGLLLDRGRTAYNSSLQVEACRIYGNIDQYAYFYVDILVGTPPQRASVILDTGSGVTAFPCVRCTHCGEHIDPAFNFSATSTAQWVSCNECLSSSCVDQKCKYHQGYTEGSAIEGFWFEDLVSLGDTLQHNPPVLAKVGCHTTENNLFFTQKASGILGMGPHGRYGFRSLIQTLFHDSHVNGDVFAVCLAEWGGQLNLGGSDESYHTGPVQEIGLSVASGYYGVELTKMRVDGVEINGPFGRTIIDSGTTYTYMNHNHYIALTYAIEDYCARHDGCGAVQTGQCWDVQDGPAGLERFPDIEVIFGSTVTRWVPRAYLYWKSRSSKYCYAFADDGGSASTTLGAAWMQHQDIVFDMARMKVGIAPAACPEWRTRPTHIASVSVVPAGTASPSPGPADAVAAPAPSAAPASTDSTASAPPSSPTPDEPLAPDEPLTPNEPIAPDESPRSPAPPPPTSPTASAAPPPPPPPTSSTPSADPPPPPPPTSAATSAPTPASPSTATAAASSTGPATAAATDSTAASATSAPSPPASATSTSTTSTTSITSTTATTSTTSTTSRRSSTSAAESSAAAGQDWWNSAPSESAPEPTAVPAPSAPQTLTPKSKRKPPPGAAPAPRPTPTPWAAEPAAVPALRPTPSPWAAEPAAVPALRPTPSPWAPEPMPAPWAPEPAAVPAPPPTPSPWAKETAAVPAPRPTPSPWAAEPAPAPWAAEPAAVPAPPPTPSPWAKEPAAVPAPRPTPSPWAAEPAPAPWAAEPAAVPAPPPTPSPWAKEPAAVPAPRPTLWPWAPEPMPAPWAAEPAAVPAPRPTPSPWAPEPMPAPWAAEPAAVPALRPTPSPWAAEPAAVPAPRPTLPPWAAEPARVAEPAAVPAPRPTFAPGVPVAGKETPGGPEPPGHGGGEPPGQGGGGGGTPKGGGHSSAANGWHLRETLVWLSEDPTHAGLAAVAALLAAGCGCVLFRRCRKKKPGFKHVTSKEPKHQEPDSMPPEIVGVGMNGSPAGPDVFTIAADADDDDDDDFALWDDEALGEQLEYQLEVGVEPPLGGGGLRSAARPQAGRGGGRSEDPLSGPGASEGFFSVPSPLGSQAGLNLPDDEWKPQW